MFLMFLIFKGPFLLLSLILFVACLNADSFGSYKKNIFLYIIAPILFCIHVKSTLNIQILVFI